MPAEDKGRARDPSDCFVYGLWEPGTAGEIRYVGKTTTGRRRFVHYKNDRTQTLRGEWLRRLRSQGKTFAVVILERARPELLGERERYWISWCRARRFQLVNHTDGGDGTPGRAVSQETRRKMSLAQKGKKRSPEVCAKLSAAQRKAHRDPGLRAVRAERARGNSHHLGHRHSAKTRSELSEKLRVLKHTHPECTARGEQSGGAKLTEKDVREIRTACAAGESQHSVALRFGIGDAQVSYIVRRKSWAHVK